jgi:hypothetical protein
MSERDAVYRLGWIESQQKLLMQSQLVDLFNIFHYFEAVSNSSLRARVA